MENEKEVRKSHLDVASCKIDCKPEVSNQNNDSLVCEQNGCFQEKQSVRKEHFQIEVDAAEDKGSRLTMEDAWVVLSDASLEFPGKLRGFLLFV